MKISYNWLRSYIEFNHSPEEIGEILTQIGLEVEGIEKVEKIPGGLSGIVVGEVIACKQHAYADKLKITSVDIGQDTPSTIICGALNVAQGQKVLVATVDTLMCPPIGDPFRIKKKKIRGVVSEGMICAEDEIGLGDRHNGIMVLDTALPNGTSAATLFETEEDHILEIGLTPNRGDATSHMGVARDLKAFFKKELISPVIRSFQIEKKRPIKVRVESSEACPRYSGITIRNIEVKPSPDWLQWRLRSIGLSPINNIVDITNYVLHAVGQPIHAFDTDKIKEDTVIVKTLPEKTKFKTLDGKERALNEKDLMICNGKGEGMCIAGVFGGFESGITTETKNIFLEVACFSPEWIRGAAQRHGLSTDASFRYERGTDPEVTLLALKQAISMVLDMAGGKVSSEIVDIYSEKREKKKIATTFQYFHRVIGKELPNGRILEILNWLDIETKHVTEIGFDALVPTYRIDVVRPVDLVEEVLRIYGFNEIEPDVKHVAGYPAEFNECESYRVQESLSGFLTGSGFSEILTSSFTNPSYYENFPIDEKPVQMLDSSGKELIIMKTSPLYTVLESVSHNIKRKNVNLKFFEMSRTYKKDHNDYKEAEWLSLSLSGKESNENWMNSPKETTFHDLSNAIQAMLKYAGIRQVALKPLEHHVLYQYGATINHEGATLGHIGKLKEALTSIYNIQHDVFYAQLEWKCILALYKSNTSYKSVSKYPEVKRDLSLVLNKSIPYAVIEQLAFQQEKELLNRINLFSIYEGEKVEKGEKAYAISFFLQDKSGTLTDKKIEKSMNRLMNLYEQELGAYIRK